MSSFLQKLFKRSRKYDTKSEFETDLLLSDRELIEAVRHTDSWTVRVNALMNDADRHTLYRNLVRLTAICRVDKEKIHIIVSNDGQRSEVLRNEFLKRGFPDVRIEEGQWDMVADTPAEYGNDEYTLFKEFMVVGMQYHVRNWENLQQILHDNDKVVLAADIDNKYDKNAIAVRTWESHSVHPKNFHDILGYVPKELNTEIASLIKAGYHELLEARVAEFNCDKGFSSRLKIRVLLRNKKSVEQD